MKCPTSEPTYIKRKILLIERSTSFPPLSRKFSATVKPVKVTRAPGDSFICP